MQVYASLFPTQPYSLLPILSITRAQKNIRPRITPKGSLKYFRGKDSMRQPYQQTNRYKLSLRKLILTMVLLSKFSLSPVTNSNTLNKEGK